MTLSAGGQHQQAGQGAAGARYAVGTSVPALPTSADDGDDDGDGGYGRRQLRADAVPGQQRGQRRGRACDAALQDRRLQQRQHSTHRRPARLRRLAPSPCWGGRACELHVLSVCK